MVIAGGHIDSLPCEREFTFSFKCMYPRARHFTADMTHCKTKQRDGESMALTMQRCATTICVCWGTTLCAAGLTSHEERRKSQLHKRSVHKTKSAHLLASVMSLTKEELPSVFNIRGTSIHKMFKRKNFIFFSTKVASIENANPQHSVF